MSNILAKAVEALDIVAAQPYGITVTDLAQAMDTSKSTASRLLASLVDEGLLERDDAQRHFLDVRFWNWGAQSIRRLSVLDVARPHVLAAVKKHGVPAYVAVAREGKAIYLESISLLSGDPFLNLVSYVVPIYACAPGKAILANSPQESIDTIVNGPLEAFTPNTFATRESLVAELETVCRHGYAVNRGEYSDNGTLAIAVPIFDQTGYAIASICFHNLRSEDLAESLVTPLVELGKTVSGSLGYTPAVHYVVG